MYYQPEREEYIHDIYQPESPQYIKSEALIKNLEYEKALMITIPHDL